MFRDEILTWRHPVSAAQGFSAEPPSWPSHPQTLVSSPLTLCTVPPSSSSSVRGVAPAKNQYIKITVKNKDSKHLRLQNINYLKKNYWTFTSYPKGFFSTKLTSVNLGYKYRAG